MKTFKTQNALITKEALVKLITFKYDIFQFPQILHKEEKMHKMSKCTC